MAYMNQEKKAAIAAELGKVIPSEWKWRLGVRDKSTIELTLLSAPADLLGEHKRARDARQSANPGQHSRAFNAAQHGCFSPNEYWIKEDFVESGELFERIVGALNFGNHDRSDSQRDHFDVGHYVRIRVGVSGEKPFIGGSQWEAQREERELAKVVKKASGRGRASAALADSAGPTASRSATRL